MSNDLVARLTLAAQGDGASDFTPATPFTLLLEARDEIDRLRGEFAFICGYLLEHRRMLKHNGTHPKIVDAVEWLEKRVAALTALDGVTK